MLPKLTGCVPPIPCQFFNELLVHLSDAALNDAGCHVRLFSVGVPQLFVSWLWLLSPYYHPVLSACCLPLLYCSSDSCVPPAFLDHAWYIGTRERLPNLNMGATIECSHTVGKTADCIQRLKICLSMGVSTGPQTLKMELEMLSWTRFFFGFHFPKAFTGLRLCNCNF